MNFQPDSARISKGLVTLERRFKEQFLKPVWVREWCHRGRHQLGLSRSLRLTRSLPGFGIDDPYEIRLEHSKLSSRTVADGLTLGELWGTGQLSNRESFVRALLEQLLLGLARLHDGLAMAHGFLCTDNIRLSSKGRASLWGVPTIPWDYSELPVRAMGLFDPSKIGTRILGDPAVYCSPDRNAGPTCDIYSLCRIAQDLLRTREISEEMSALFAAGTLVQASRRPTLRALAKALNPDTLLSKLDVLKGAARRQCALKHFRNGEMEQAEELWQEARDYDPLSAVVWNNLGVIEMTRGRFEAAFCKLKRAKELCASHPRISGNLAVCHWYLKDFETTEFFARQANIMNPSLSLPYVALSLFYQSRGLFEFAASHAYQAMALSPHASAPRIRLAEVYRLMGASDKARGCRRRVSEMPGVSPFEINLIDETEQPTWGKIRVSYGNISLAPRLSR